MNENVATAAYNITIHASGRPAKRRLNRRVNLRIREAEVARHDPNNRMSSAYKKRRKAKKDAAKRRAV